MLDLPLAPTDDLAQPAFTDVASCRAWLQQLQLTNLHQAHSIFRQQLDEFNRYPLRGLVRFQLLELIRETVVLVQMDYAKKLISKKLPLSDDELTIFLAIVDLWQGLVVGYQRCLQAFQAGDPQLASHAALLVQRCLRYSGLEIFEYLRTGYEFEAKLWHQLHSLFAFAETHGFQQHAVADTLHAQEQTSSCQAVYVKTLLACHAHPAELTRRQLQLLDRWFTQWNEALLIDKNYQYSQGDAPPLLVDLDGAQGLLPLASVPTTTSLRYLSMVPLSKLLRVKTILLQQGQSPQQLELGNELTGTEAADFLTKLHRYCCETQPQRQAERHPVAQSAAICFGIEGVYANIANKPFKHNAKAPADNALARQQIAAFGRVLSDTNRHDLNKIGLGLEHWQIENESIFGARLLREEVQRERLAAQQLIAIKPNDANAFMLGKISWVLANCHAQLRIGVNYFPGMAQPVSIKHVGINSMSDKTHPALWLPAVSSFKTVASLVVPREFFLPSRQAEVTHLDGRVEAIQMGALLDKGADFDRITFASI